MKVNDYKFWKGRIETAPDDSTGAFDKFVQGSRNMDQEPRNMYNQGSSVDHAVRTIDPVQDSGNKIEEVLKAYGRYRGSRKGKRPMKFKNFFELYATENFADGGQAGQLVQPNDDGSRPGYAGDKSLEPGGKKTVGIGKEPGIIKVSTRSSDKIKYVINYTDNEGNRKKFMSTESFKNITEAKKERNKKINFFEKQLNIPEGKLLDETYTTRRNNINLLPKNKKNYISLTELRTLLGPMAKDMRAVGGSKDTVVAKASAKLLNQTKITSKNGADYFFYKKPTDKELNLLKTYVDARPIQKDMFERIKNLQKDKYTDKILKDGKLPMNADGVLDNKFLNHVSKNYGTLDKYVHGLVRYTQALDGQTIIGLNDSILSDGKFKTNKKIANKIVNVFLETPYGSSNASQNTIKKAVYKAAMNDITNELGNTETTFENFKNKIRSKINNDFKLKGKGIEIDELIGVSTSFRNKTAPYAVFTQLATKELNQGVLKDYQKVVSNYTAKLKNEINKNSKFVDGKWFHSAEAKNIVNNFNTKILPNLKNIDQLKETSFSLPELTLGSPTDKTLGGTKGRLNTLEKAGLNFKEFYKQEGFGYTMPEGSVTQKEILGDKKVQANLLKKLDKNTSKALFSFMKRNGIKCNLANGINCGQPEAYVKSINELKAKAAAGDKKAAEQLVKVTKGMSKGGTLLRSLIGPGAILFEPVYEGVVAANKVLDGKPLNQAWAESYLSYLDSERVDPKTLERNEMLYRQIEGPERKVKGGQGTVRDTINIDAPGASKLRPLFAAEDTMAAFQKAKADKEKVFQTRGVDRIDIRDKAAADIRDMRKTGSVNFAKQIINDPATQKALSDAQEYIAAKRGAASSVAQSAQADEQRRKKAMKAEGMLTIEDDAKNELQDIGDYYGQGYTPFGLNKLFEEFGVQNPGYGIEKVGPATGKYNEAQGLQDFLNSMRMQQVADAGGVANLAGGGIAGLSGGDKSGRPPESGPASQGLRSLYKNGRKL